MFGCFRNYSNDAHHVCCEDSPTKGLYGHCLTDDLDLRSRTSAYQTWLLFNLQYLGQYLSSYIQTWNDGRQMLYMLMLVSMTLALLQGHSGSAKANNQRWMLSATRQAICIKHVCVLQRTSFFSFFLFYLTLILQMFIWLIHLVLLFTRFNLFSVFFLTHQIQSINMSIFYVMNPQRLIAVCAAIAKQTSSKKPLHFLSDIDLALQNKIS